MEEVTKPLDSSIVFPFIVATTSPFSNKDLFFSILASFYLGVQLIAKRISRKTAVLLQLSMLSQEFKVSVNKITFATCKIVMLR